MNDQTLEPQQSGDMMQQVVRRSPMLGSLLGALAHTGLCKSSSDARRLIEQGAVQVDGQKVSDLKASLAVGGPYVVKAGKRAWARITVR